MERERTFQIYFSAQFERTFQSCVKNGRSIPQKFWQLLAFGNCEKLLYKSVFLNQHKTIILSSDLLDRQITVKTKMNFDKQHI